MTYLSGKRVPCGLVGLALAVWSAPADGGCGCRLAGGPRTSNAWVLMLAFGLSLVRRRRFGRLSQQ
jgi:MYXO-CTERM domain-containing protein